MKTILRIAAIVGVIVFVIFLLTRASAQVSRPTMPGNPVYLSWLTAQPAFGQTGGLAKFVIKAEYSQVEMKVSGEFVVNPVAKIEFDLMHGSDDDRKLAEMLDARAILEYRTTFPPPLDDMRRATRVP